MTPDNTPAVRLKRPGRLRGAWLSLRGEPTVPDQIRAEWAAWVLELEGVCDKLTAAAGRVYARDKRELDKALKRLAAVEAEADCECKDEPLTTVGTSGWNPEKRALNRRILAGRGVRIPEYSTVEQNGASDERSTEGE